MFRTTAGSKDGEALAPQSIGEQEGIGDLSFGGGGRQIDGLGHPAVAVVLENGLHSDMMSRIDVVGRDEQTTKL